MKYITVLIIGLVFGALSQTVYDFYHLEEFLDNVSKHKSVLLEKYCE